MEKKYYIAVEGTRQGPFTLRELINRGLAADTLVWTKGMDGWAEAGTLPELAPAIDDEPPELPAVEPPHGAAQPAPAHQPVPAPDPWRQAGQCEQPARQVKRKRRRTVWWVLLGLVAVMLVALPLSRPSRADHAQAIASAVNGYVSDRIDSSLVGDVPLLGGAVKAGSGAIIAGFVDANLRLDDHLLWNVGRMAIGGSVKTVSVGVLGHVFTFDKRDVAEAVNTYLAEERDKTDEERRQMTVGRQIGAAIDSVAGKINKVKRAVERMGQAIDAVAGSDVRRSLRQQADSAAVSTGEDAQRQPQSPDESVVHAIEDFFSGIAKSLGLD